MSEVVARVVGELVKVYGPKDFSLMAFEVVLEGYQDETVMGAFREWLGAEKWMPKPAEFRAVCDRIEGGRYKADQDADRRAYWACMAGFGAALRGESPGFFEGREYAWMVRQGVVRGGEIEQDQVEVGRMVEVMG